MLRTLQVLSSLALLGSLSGCIIVIKEEHWDDEGWDEPGYGGSEPGYPGDGVDDDPIAEPACTEESYASVLVHIVDADGLPLPGAAVTWTGPDGVTQEGQCMDEECTSFVTGWEVSGIINIQASYDANTEDPCCWLTDETDADVEVTLSSDGCHVETEEITLSLIPQLTCADNQDCG